jgi:hypothetical protein
MPHGDLPTSTATAVATNGRRCAMASDRAPRTDLPAGSSGHLCTAVNCHPSGPTGAVSLSRPGDNPQSSQPLRKSAADLVVSRVIPSDHGDDVAADRG